MSHWTSGKFVVAYVDAFVLLLVVFSVADPMIFSILKIFKSDFVTTSIREDQILTGKPKKNIWFFFFFSFFFINSN